MVLQRSPKLGQFEEDGRVVTETNREPRPGVNPHDTYASSGFRFLIEVAAWIGGPWAAVDLLGAWWAAIPTALVLLLLPAVFNTPGDKKITGVPTPGSIRIGIEALLLGTAVYGAWQVWEPWLAIVVTLSGALMVLFGMPRYRWLLRGAPTGDSANG